MGQTYCICIEIQISSDKNGKRMGNVSNGRGNIKISEKVNIGRGVLAPC